MQLSEHTDQGTVDCQLVLFLSKALVDSACTLGVHGVLGGNGSSLLPPSCDTHPVPYS